jgi:hypothetical protein
MAKMDADEGRAPSSEILANEAPFNRIVGGCTSHSAEVLDIGIEKIKLAREDILSDERSKMAKALLGDHVISNISRQQQCSYRNDLFEKRETSFLLSPLLDSMNIYLPPT